MPKQFTLGKQERLKSRKTIDELFKKGSRFNVHPFRVFYQFHSSQPQTTVLQFGIGVSTRNFGKAVDRNRVKRLTREAYRLQKNPLEEQVQQQQQSLTVFFVYTTNELPVFNLVYEKLGVILKKLQKIAHENSAPHS